jgi:transcription termination factor Rho
LTPLHPDQRIVMEYDPAEVDAGRGHDDADRVRPARLIVSPPRAGKTILMQKMAKAVLKNFPRPT